MATLMFHQQPMPKERAANSDSFSDRISAPWAKNSVTNVAK